MNAPTTPARPWLRERRLEPEIMDQPELDATRHEAALAGLARINWISRSASNLWAPLRNWARTHTATLRVLDIASGGGDVTCALAQRAERARLPLHLEGCDFSPRAVAFAQRRAGGRARFFEHDVLAHGVPEGYDIVICSLFFHHLTALEARHLLSAMAQQVRVGLAIHDLRRSSLGLLMAYAGTRVLSRSDVVHTDGVLSARAAFSSPEFADLARDAGLAGARLTTHWPERLRLVWSRA